ncbi:unnamed protein product [Acanthoscelides obtectus]|uniref:Uncharacterized protein n=1 Tax=Acanthoscelides obtectus TaxID=200917 RepID=A0A9P0KM28_ACAOB|nr:unnamed protein product [Acanthoscelides obtectus]CAK1623731.1 hypothetical protein AOBTE_LOCUS2141 [Acanthoscelides obtectus]
MNCIKSGKISETTFQEIFIKGKEIQGLELIGKLLTFIHRGYNFNFSQM